ncbi:YccT family protein [Plesiomonas shigelloides]|uniref:YccT family protein n=1 Tax=Plesiomonas shigelloides TaxID=703 RepID=UPI001C5BF782|nr:DUF2057 domain-containing protein [Plesiomonas shigelloides]MBW3794153.1 DUF2057 domain-containing protein [Plesiomonas shigelloides]
MLIRKTLLCTLIGVSSFTAQAAVNLELPPSLVMIMVNGEEATPDMLKAQLKSPTFVLPDGENQIVFRYENMVRNSGGYEKFASDAYIVKFDASNQNLKLEIPKIENRDEALLFAKKQNYTINNVANNAPIAIAKDVLMSGGFQFVRDFDKELYKYNQQNKPASLPSINVKMTNLLGEHTGSSQPAAAVASTVVATTAPVQASAPATTAVSNNKNIEQLQQLFNQYDSETQKKFISWAVQNIK